MSVYQEAILKARKEFLKLSSSQEKEMLKLYIELANQFKIDISRCRTSSQERYLKNLHDIVEANIRDLDKELNKMVKDSIEASSQIASSVDLAYYEAITEDARLSAMFKSIALNNSRKTVRKLIQGDFYKDKRSLDARLWSVSDKSIKDVDTLIKINVLKGANARELAKEVERYVNPAKKLAIKQDYVGFNKNISYQSARLARTSITHSFSETTIENGKTNPFNKGIKWNLSASHFARMHGKRDICDDYAGRVFKPNEVPIQHPNCLCYLTEENADIEQAIKELKAWTKGEKNPKLDKWYEKYSKKPPIKGNDNVLNKENSGIIKSENKENKSKFYKSVESNVQWNKYLDISERNSKKLNDIHTSLNQFMHINNREKLVLLDIETNVVIHELEGDKDNKVNLIRETNKVFKNSKENSIIFSHNHPSKTTFSRFDIQHIIRHKSIKSLTVECVDGTKYIIDRGKLKSSIIKDYGFFSKYDKIYDNIAKKYPQLDDENEIYKVWDDFLDEVTKKVADEYGMIYKKVRE